MVVTLVIVVLVLINTLYVAAEFSAVSVRRSRLEELARSGNRAARLLTTVIRDPAALDRYVAACQIGITVSSLVLGAYGQATVAAPLAPRLSAAMGLDAATAESVSVVGVLIALTVLQVIVGELVPKSIALQYPTKTALVTYLIPGMALALGIAFLDEPLTVAAVAGLALVLAGVALGSGMLRSARRREPVTAPAP